MTRGSHGAEARGATFVTKHGMVETVRSLRTLYFGPCQEAEKRLKTPKPTVPQQHGKSHGATFVTKYGIIETVRSLRTLYFGSSQEAEKFPHACLISTQSFESF